VARQGKVLDEFGITHVISIQGKPISPFSVNAKERRRLPNFETIFSFSKHREYLLIPARDHISQDLLQFVVQCNDFIHNARLNHGKVLIHW
jgi:protein-tyrosine phosphatase